MPPPLQSHLLRACRSHIRRGLREIAVPIRFNSTWKQQPQTEEEGSWPGQISISIPFDHHFTAGSPDEVTKNFNVEVTANQNLTDDAYMLIQVQGISSVHSITLNDDNVQEGGGLVPAPGGSSAWRVGLNHISPGALVRGNNKIKIKRFGNDEFRVGWIVVHWREE